MGGTWSTWRVNTLHSGSSCEGGGGYPGVIGLRHSIKIDKTFLSPDLSIYFNPIHVKYDTAPLLSYLIISNINSYMDLVV